MPQLYASARESINASSSRNNAKFANTVLRSMFSFGFYLVHSLVHISFNLWATQGYLAAQLSFYYLHCCYKYSFYKDLNLTINEQVKDTASIEITAPNMLKDKALFIPFIAFILLHIGQWMYTMNMPLFVTEYLKEREGYVGTLASLCAGLEVPLWLY